MAEVLFNDKGIETKIECNFNDKMKDVLDKYIAKQKINNKNILFLYNGIKINEELNFYEQANKADIKRGKLNVYVYDKDENNTKEGKLMKSKDIICPECKENIFIELNDYRINLYECKNNHIRNNIPLEEYENTQMIDLSRIQCDNCKENSLDYTCINEFYICNSCNMKLCSSCEIKHDSSHKVINYNHKNYICKKHDKFFSEYCKECKESLCKSCKIEHIMHDIIHLQDMVIIKKDLLEQNDEFKLVLDKLRNNIEEIKNVLNKILNKIELYYIINKGIINNYNCKRINYYILKNINEIKDNNNNIIQNLKSIVEENDLNKKFNYLMNIYDSNNSQYKTEVYENGDKYIGKFINNKKNGKGIIYYNDGDQYEGDWKNDKIEGKGIFYWKDGERYEGDWKNEKMEGKGKYYYKNGEIYEGDWINNIREGKGIYYFKDGNRYEGEWKNDKFEGKGIYYFKNGERYEGDFKNYKMEGFGIFYYPNGDKKIGFYKNDVPIGNHQYIKKKENNSI